MYDELTRQDIQKMQEEIDYRVQVLRPKLIEDVQTARAFGDLSENFEYKCAKQEKNRNDSRIRYLQRMIKTARVIEDHSRADTAGLYDTVEILMENTGKTRKIQLVTTLRQDALKGLISKESPVGKAVLGRRSGDRVQVDMGGGRGYWLQILSIEKGSDDGSIPGSVTSPSLKSASSPRLFAFAPACSSISGDRSMPVTLQPSLASTMLKIPGPQPASSARIPGFAPSSVLNRCSSTSPVPPSSSSQL